MQTGRDGAKKLSLNLIGNKMAMLWLKSYKWLFFAYLLVVIALGGYIWQKSTSESAWSQEKKDQYIASIDKGISFRENNFKAVLEDISGRKERFSQGLTEIRNVFK